MVGVVHEVFEEFEFLGGEFDCLAVSCDCVGLWVEGEVGDLELGTGTGGGAGPGLDAGDEDFGSEGLGDVVVGAEIEAFGEVVWGVFGGKHDDDGLWVFFFEFFAEGFASDIWEIEVEENDVWGDLVDEFAGLYAGFCGVCLIAVVDEELFGVVSDVFVIFDDEHCSLHGYRIA